MSARRHWAARVAVGCLALLLPAGCFSVPDSGPVVATGVATGAPEARNATYIDPRPPQPGASQAQVAQGFLDAMTATPINEGVARQFLAPDIRDSWDPEQATITYAEASTRAEGSTVDVDLTDADRLDGRGEWRGRLPADQDRLQLPMTMQDGEWRIARVPQALIVPESWFEDRFAQVSVYFFDPTGQILVPEPVFVPQGQQLATSLVQGLLRGPGDALRTTARTFIPPGLSAGLSVPISRSGVADIDLTGDAPVPSARDVELLTAQLVWTLRQDPSVTQIQLAIDGQQVQLPGDRTRFDVQGGAEYDPSGFQSSAQLFGLRGGVVVSGTPPALAPVPGELGSHRLGLRSVAADLIGDRLAGVTSSGRTLLVGRATQGAGVTTAVAGADDLLPPVWDFAERLWVVDRRPDGARVSYLYRGRVRPVRVPGITGTDVRDVVVSRDGSRLVAVVRRGGVDGLRVSRILDDSSGRVRRATPALSIGTDDDGGAQRIADIGWDTPTTLAVLHPSSGVAQVRTVSVDGAPSGFDALTVTVRGSDLSLVSSPDPDDTLYAFDAGTLTDLTQGAVSTVQLAGRVTSLGYAG